MYKLESPGKRAGFRVERDDGVGPLAVACSQAAVVVGAGASGWHEDQIALGVGRHH